MTSVSESDDLDAYITAEIDRRLSSATMTWKKLDACFKWRMLRDYMSACGASSAANEAHVRGLLVKGELVGVQYDARVKRITRVNHDADSVCASMDCSSTSIATSP